MSRAGIYVAFYDKQLISEQYTYIVGTLRREERKQLGNHQGDTLAGKASEILIHGNFAMEIFVMKC